MEAIGRWLSLLKVAYDKGNDDGFFDMGATLAYYALFSLFPLVLLTLALVGFFVDTGTALRDQIIELAPAQAAELLDEVLDNLNNNATSASLIGLFTLLLSASGFFGALNRMFDRIWSVEAPESAGLVASALTFVRSKLVAFLLVLGVAAVALSSVVLSTTITALSETTASLPGSDWLWWAVQLLAPLLLLTFVYAALFRFLPSRHIAWGDVWLGGAVSALLFTLLQQVIGLYLGSSDLASYGAIGAVMALLVWFYFLNVLLVFGGELTWAYAYRFGSRRGADAPEASQPVDAQATSEVAPRPRDWRGALSILAIWGILSVVLGILGRRHRRA